MTRLMWTLLAVATSLGLGYFIGQIAKPSYPNRAEPPLGQNLPSSATITDAPLTSSGNDSIPLRDAAVLKLADAGWDQSAARSVIVFHWDWLVALFEVDREGYDRTLIKLAQMPSLGEYWQVLREHPEFAGLLGMVNDPVALARELRDGDRNVLASLFLTRLDRTEAEELASALPGNSALIADLYRRGLVGAEVLFSFQRDRPGAAEYESWLRTTLREAITRPDDQLAGVFMLLLEEGATIRKRMTQDEQFRLRFPSVLSCESVDYFLRLPRSAGTVRAGGTLCPSDDPWPRSP